MRKYVIASFVCLIGLIGIAVYSASSSLDFRTTEQVIMNGEANKVLVINYNGHVYVPLRFIAENMAADVQYEADTRKIMIDQFSVKFDEQIMAPVPYVAYEKKTRNGTVWMQEIPLVQGSSCWMGCVHVPGALTLTDEQAEHLPVVMKPKSEYEIAHLIEQAEYPPVVVKPESDLVIQYPKGLEPKTLEVIMEPLSVSAQKEEKIMSMDGNWLHLSEKTGLYLISIRSNWDEGYTLYAFVIEIR